MSKILGLEPKVLLDIDGGMAQTKSMKLALAIGELWGGIEDLMKVYDEHSAEIGEIETTVNFKHPVTGKGYGLKIIVGSVYHDGSSEPECGGSEDSADQHGGNVVS